MNKIRFGHLMFAGALAAVIHAAPAQAQTRTWVSGTGNDGNPCSRTLPCLTFAGALTKTAAGGEISVLDPGGYINSTLTINKAITINGEGTLASGLVTSGTAITIAAGATDQVILRNLSINGAGSSGVGIAINSGNVTIDKCFIYGFTNGFIGGFGILINASGSLNVDIRDAALTNNSWGVGAQTSSGTVTVSVDNVHINAAANGVATLSGGVLMSVRNSYIKNATSSAVSTPSGASTITLDHTMLTNNGTAVNASASGSTIRLNEVSMFDNTTGLAIGAGATIATANNNHSAGNTTSAGTNGTVNTF
jgi:hypothetical protein